MPAIVPNSTTSPTASACVPVTTAEVAFVMPVTEMVLPGVPLMYSLLPWALMAVEVVMGVFR